MENFRNTLEHSAFEFFAYVGDKMGISRTRVRTYFIYLSCLTLGSPLLFYFFVTFWLNIKRYLREGASLLH
jgi:hypothetical protein